VLGMMDTEGNRLPSAGNQKGTGCSFALFLVF
jgi:hypothetical protein